MEPQDVKLPASKTRINKAGEVLRRTAEEKGQPGPDYRDSLELVRAYRAIHAYPLKSVTMGLRHHAKKAAGNSWLDISQRLKQLPTITDKLVRMPKTNLARIQDIGGCRATFLDQATVDAAIASIENRATRGSSWDIVDIDDYINERPRRDGHRAKQGRAEEWAVEAVASAAEDMRRYEVDEIDRPRLVEALNSSLRPILDLAGGAEIR